MKIPTITGIIDRRLLINYRVDSQVLSRYLPAPFRPKLVNGYGIAGICLIRLKNIRPKGMPGSIGISSENGAHRIAVEWAENGIIKEGVYIPRRDTSSALNTLAGGCVFPGVHHKARFTVDEKDGAYHVSFKSDDGTHLSINARETDRLNDYSIFDDLDQVSQFFEQGAVGYSPHRFGDAFDGLELSTKQWKVSPLSVSQVRSGFFEDEQVFPKGSVIFDNALLMTNIEHEWQSLQSIKKTSYQEVRA